MYGSLFLFVQIREYFDFLREEGSGKRMNYAKDQTKDTAYVSVNALIQSKKKGRGYLPAYAQFQKEQGQPDTPPEEEVEPKAVGDPEKIPADMPKEQAVANGDPVQEAPASEIESSPGSVSEGSAPEAAQQIEPSDGSGLSKDVGFELDETDVPKGEEKETKPEEKQLIQKKRMTAGGGEGNEDSASDPGAEQFKALGGNGEPLPGGVQAKMEPALGMDLQNVRIHRDGQASAMSEDLGARAFTSGQDIYFNQGEYNPDTTSGNHLIAHELTHVKQEQTIPGLQYQLQVPAERDHYEREADATADKAVNIPRQPETKVNVSSGLNQNGGGSVQLAAKPESKGEIKKEKDSNWVLEKVGALVRNLPGYDLLALAIGRDPLSGQAVKGDAVAVIKAVMGLIPGGALLFENLEKAQIISKAIAWFKEEFQKLNLSFAAVKNMFTQAWQAIFGAPSAEKSKDDGFWGGLVKGAKRVANAAGNAVKALLSPEETFNKIKSIFLAPITRIKNFVSKAGPKLMDFIFEGAMTLAGSAGKKMMGILNKGKGVLQKIISDPIGFLKNLIDAVRGGLGNFVAHIGTHLQKGLGDWLFGTLGNAGIVLPEKLNLTGIFSLMAQILGVTWQAIRAQIVKRLGPTAEKVMDQVEKGIAFVGDFITKGPIVLMDMAKEFLGELLGGLKTLFFNSFIEWIRNTVIVKAVQKLISMFNPVGAIIQAIITIYNTVQFFIERAKQIAAFVNSVFDSIAEIAGGNIKKAVDAVENSLAKAIPLAIGFLANLVGIGGIAAKIKEIIQKIRKPIDKVVGKVVGFIVGKAKGLIAKIKRDDKPKQEPPKNEAEHDAQVKAGLVLLDSEQQKQDQDHDAAITYEEAEEAAQKVKSLYPVFKSITPVEQIDRWVFEYVGSSGKHEGLKVESTAKHDEEPKKEITPKQKALNKLSQLPPFTGEKTSGIFETPGMPDIKLMSGTQGPSFQYFKGVKVPGMDLNTKSHVEAHAAALIRKHGIKEATLYINNPPCSYEVKGIQRGCQHYLPKMLPEGSKLTVIAPNGYKQLFIGLPD